MYHIICKNYTKLKRLVFFTTCFKPLLGWKSHIHVHGKRGWNNRRGLSVSFHHFSNDRLGWQQGVCCTPPSKEVLLKPERCWSLSNYSGIPPHFLSLSPWSVCRLFAPPARLFPSLSLSVFVKEAQLTLASLLRREKSSSHPHTASRGLTSWNDAEIRAKPRHSLLRQIFKMAAMVESVAMSQHGNESGWATPSVSV